MIEAIQSLLMIRTQELREVELGGGINLALKRNLELDIHRLQMLIQVRGIFKIKQSQKE